MSIWFAQDEIDQIDEAIRLRREMEPQAPAYPEDMDMSPFLGGGGYDSGGVTEAPYFPEAPAPDYGPAPYQAEYGPAFGFGSPGGNWGWGFSDLDTGPPPNLYPELDYLDKPKEKRPWLDELGWQDSDEPRAPGNAGRPFLPDDFSGDASFGPFSVLDVLGEGPGMASGGFANASARQYLEDNPELAAQFGLPSPGMDGGPGINLDRMRGRAAAMGLPADWRQWPSEVLGAAVRGELPFPEEAGFFETAMGLLDLPRRATTVPLQGAIAGAVTGDFPTSYNAAFERGMELDQQIRDIPHVGKALGTAWGIASDPLNLAGLGLADDFGRAFRAGVGATTGAAVADQWGSDIRGLNLLPESVRPLVGGLIGGTAGYTATPAGIRATGEFFNTGPGRKFVPALSIEDVSKQVEAKPELPAWKKEVIRALNEEENLRKVGTVDREVHEGRVDQAKRIQARLIEGRDAGLTGRELADYAVEGARVGPLRKTVAPPLKLTPEAAAEMFQDISQQRLDLKLQDFEYMNAVTAAKKLLTGQGAYPGDIRITRRVLGDEVADALARRPRQRMVDADALEQRQTARYNEQAQARQQRELNKEIAQLNRESANPGGAGPNARLSPREAADVEAARAKWEGIAARGATERELRDLLDPLRTSPEERALAKEILDKQAGAAQRLGKRTEGVLGRQEMRSQQRAEQKAVREAREARETADRDFYRKKWQAIQKQNDIDQQVIDDMLNPLRTTQEERDIAQAALNERHNRILNETGKIDEKMRAERHAASPEGRTQLAKDFLEAWTGRAADPEQVAIVRQAVEHWERATIARLGNIGPATQTALTRIVDASARRLAGDVPDSYLATTLHSQNHLERILIAEGMPEDLARKVSNTMGEAMLARRWPNGVPQNIREQIESTRKPTIGDVSAYDALVASDPEFQRPKIDPRTKAPVATPRRTFDPVTQTLGQTMDPKSEGMAWVELTPEQQRRAIERYGPRPDPALTPGEFALEGLGRVSQTTKNSMFGLGDIAVIGQQALKAVGTEWVPAVVGIVNRMLNQFHLGVDTTGMLPRRIAYQTDGVIQGGRGVAVSDFANDQSVLSWFGKPGQWVDQHLYAPAVQKMNDFQFGFVMGGLRNLIHEGNLTMAHRFGADISDPIVRANIANYANYSTGAAEAALTRNRANAERAFLLSPSMRRAQVGQILKVVSGLASGNREEVIASAATLFSLGVTLLAVGKLLNDRYGLTDFEFDPSKPGFGRITVGFGPDNKATTVSLFPQEQVLTYFAQAARTLAEGDPDETARALAKLGISSASPPVGIGLRAGGVGFDPISGSYKTGDWGQGLSGPQRALTFAPLPPVFSGLMLGKVNQFNLGLELIGLSNSAESEYAFKLRVRDEYPQWKGRPLKAGEPDALDADEMRVFNREVNSRLGRTPEEARDLLPPEIRQARAEREATEQVYRNKIRIASERYQEAEAREHSSANGKAFREALDDAGLARQAERQKAERDNTIPYKDRTPKDRALSDYYDAFDRARDPVSLKVDPNSQQLALAELLKTWTPEQVNYVREHIGARSVAPEVAAGDTIADIANVERQTSLGGTAAKLFDDQRKIAESGYWDAKGKVKFLEEHPDVLPLLERWGYAEKTREALDVYRALEASQRAADAALDSGAMLPKDWREDLHQRQRDRLARIDQVYKDASSADKPASTPEEQQIQKARDFIEGSKPVDPDTGKPYIDAKPDWDAFDRYLADNPEVAAAWDAREKRPVSETVQRYRNDTKLIAESGYWDVRDSGAKQFVAYYELPKALDTYDKLWNYAYQQYLPQALSYYKGDREVAMAQAQLAADKALSELDKQASKYMKDWRDNVPELTRTLIRWGYYDASGKAVEKLLSKK